LKKRYCRKKPRINPKKFFHLQHLNKRLTGNKNKRRCKHHLILEKKQAAVMMIGLIMLRDFVQIVTIDLVESRNLGGVPMKNFMLLVCVKTAT
jgi:hypothetical protein